jgi:hypothetical protein
MQTSPPVQTVPQPPQLFALVDVSTQVLLHKVWVTGHWQTPPEQIRPPVQISPPAPAQAPQLFASVSVSTHVPPQQDRPLLQQVMLPAGPLRQLVEGHAWHASRHCFLCFAATELQNALQSVRGPASASRLRPREASRAPASPPPSRRSASRRETPSAMLFAHSSNECVMSCSFLLSFRPKRGLALASKV